MKVINIFIIFNLVVISITYSWKLPNILKSVNHKTNKYIIPLVLSQILINAAPSYATSTLATSVSSNNNIPVYFGVGCFWHAQHEFIETEKKVLGRSNDELTSITGYAGSKSLGKDTNHPASPGIVCYHNPFGIADYGNLGYGEVVQVTIPTDSTTTTTSSSVYGKFVEEYFSLFKNGDRPDTLDRGAEYRSLVGLPGGVHGALYQELQGLADKNNIKLIEGKGNDADTLGKKIIYVMDSNVFPFQQAELYHQFHDGFMPGEQYPASYNDLVKNSFDRGNIRFTGCPDRGSPTTTSSSS